MLPLYERIEEMCKAKRINITTMCKEANIPRSALSDYKTGRKQSITLPNIQKIADYFDISIDNLLGNEPKEKQPLTFDDFTYAMYEQSQELTDEDKKQLLRMAEFMRQQRGL
ncbi:MAG: helix-turn-helix transcriptional regulator [Oscillospiraceae bacterium]